MAFTTLAHLLDVPLLERAFWSLNPNSAPGRIGSPGASINKT